METKGIEPSSAERPSVATGIRHRNIRCRPCCCFNPDQISASLCLVNLLQFNTLQYGIDSPGGFLILILYKWAVFVDGVIMDVNTAESEKQPLDHLSLARLRDAITRKWPEALRSLTDNREMVFNTGLLELDKLFPLGGIPYGQLVEITGSVSSGKTSLLFALLGHLTKGKTAAYLDFSNTFFPDAAVSSGIDLNRLVVVKPDGHSTDNLITGIRTAELILRAQRADIIVFDLVGQRTMLPISLLHRLRLKTVKAKALTIFLTQNNSQIIPTSMMSLCMEVKRSDRGGLGITVTRSRISVEGIRVEVHL